MLNNLKNLKSNRILISLAAVTLSAGFASAFASLSAQAQTSINVAVCSNDASPTVDVALPKSDSLHPVGMLELSGRATKANQLDIFVDDKYDKTIAISPSQKEFATTIELLIGTHTISLKAQGVCANEVAQTSTIVTIAPGVSDFPPQLPIETSIDDNQADLIKAPNPLITSSNDIHSQSERAISSNLYNKDVQGSVALPRLIAESVRLVWLVTFTSAAISLIFTQQIAQNSFFKKYTLSSPRVAVTAILIMLIAVVMSGAS